MVTLYLFTIVSTLFCGILVIVLVIVVESAVLIIVVIVCLILNSLKTKNQEDDCKIQGWLGKSLLKSNLVTVTSTENVTEGTEVTAQK